MFQVPDPPHPFCIDLAHNVLLSGIILSAKPQDVLEFGIGPAYTTRTILDCLRYNGCGRLVCVDNWFDTAGVEPPHVDDLRAHGAVIVVATEADYTASCPEQSFDVLVADADHHHTHERVEAMLRLVRPGGFLFFHDTANPEFPNLAQIVSAVAHLPHHHFTAQSRPDERCSRGWLFVMKS